MTHLLRGASWGLAMLLLLLLPIVVIFAAPLAIGIGLDIFEMAGEAPVALALCGPVLLLSLGVFAGQPARHFIAAHWRSPLQLGHPAKLDYVP